MTMLRFFVFMNITASYSKDADESFTRIRSLKLIIKFRFLAFNLHIRHFVTVLVDVSYEVLALLKIE